MLLSLVSGHASAHGGPCRRPRLSPHAKQARWASHSGANNVLASQKSLLHFGFGSKSVVAVMSAARLLFHRKRKSIGDLATSQTCHNRPRADAARSVYTSRTYSITLSARTSSEPGTSKPSALAVLRFLARSTHRVTSPFPGSVRPETADVTSCEASRGYLRSNRVG
jgi:hypothetical protein